MAETFPAAVVKELRDKAGRYRRRVRDLEVALIRARLEGATGTARRSVFSLPDEILERISVDENCTVQGIEPAIAFLNS